MGGVDADNDTLEQPRTKEGAAREARPLSLLVSVDGTFTSFALPDDGEVTIGRATENTIQVNHPSVSRHHALLRVGERVEIEDLGSANGVRVRDRRIGSGRTVEIAVGELVEIGQVMLFLRRATAPARPRRVWPHGYFEARVEEQVTRAERTGAPFAIVRLGVEGMPPASAIDEAFATLRPLDVLAQYAPNEYELLLPDTAPDEMDERIAVLRAPLEARHGRLRVGVARYPLDGTTPETLIAQACDAVSGSVEAAAPEAAPELEGSAMRRLRRLAMQVAASDLCVLILGETGVGKEVMAETLHRLSPRAARTFLRLHCAAFTETLLESELFGHERGAFTGAHAAKAGLLETAPGGTIFLDEIGELPASTQVKLLRVLEDRQVKRVGGLKAREIDVRFIAATNRDLETEVSLGRFRQDLYFRLNGVSLTIPPLRERVDEIEPLARTFVAQASQQSRRAPPAISDEAMEQLRRYSWPGNIRELRNAMERAVVLCGAGPIRVEHLPVDKMGATVLGAGAAATGMAEFDESANTSRVARLDAASLREDVDAFEKQRIVDALARCAGNQTQAARLLGISRGSLVARLDAYGIPRPRKGPGG